MSQIHHECELQALHRNHLERLAGDVRDEDLPSLLAKIAALNLAQKLPESELSTILFLAKHHGRAVRQLVMHTMLMEHDKGVVAA